MEIKAIPRHLWEDCPHCPNQGWYPKNVKKFRKTHGLEIEYYQEQEPEQCEFCNTNPKSVFNQQLLIDNGNDDYDEEILPF